jgi:hypothetical protein
MMLVEATNNDLLFSVVLQLFVIELLTNETKY